MRYPAGDGGHVSPTLANHCGNAALAAKLHTGGPHRHGLESMARLQQQMSSNKAWLSTRKLHGCDDANSSYGPIHVATCTDSNLQLLHASAQRGCSTCSATWWRRGPQANQCRGPAILLIALLQLTKVPRCNVNSSSHTNGIRPLSRCPKGLKQIEPLMSLLPLQLRPRHPGKALICLDTSEVKHQKCTTLLSLMCCIRLDVA
jgi:hypothetical protein